MAENKLKPIDSINSQIADITVKMAYHASKIKEHQLELQKLQEKRTKLIIKILEQD